MRTWVNLKSAWSWPVPGWWNHTTHNQIRSLHKANRHSDSFTCLSKNLSNASRSQPAHTLFHSRINPTFCLIHWGQTAGFHWQVNNAVTLHPEDTILDDRHRHRHHHWFFSSSYHILQRQTWIWPSVVLSNCYTTAPPSPSQERLTNVFPKNT